MPRLQGIAGEFVFDELLSLNIQIIMMLQT